MEQTRQGKAGRKPHKKRVKADTYDFGLFFVVLTLVLFGVVMIFSASYYETMSSKEYGYDMFYYLKRQGMWAVVGTVGMIVAMNVPYQFWKKLSPTLYWISNGLLAILPFVGKNVKGQTRWIEIGSLQFQPSEFTKVAVILYLSYYVINHRKELGNLKGFAKAAGFLALPVLLIAMTNFSSALLLLMVGVTILFVASPRIWYFVAGIGALVPLRQSCHSAPVPLSSDTYHHMAGSMGGFNRRGLSDYSVFVCCGIRRALWSGTWTEPSEILHPRSP